MSKIIREDWIIGICNTGADGVVLNRFFGTEEEVKQLLLNMAKKDAANDESYEYGTEAIEELQKDENGWYACSCYPDYHIDYSAKRLSEISFVSCIIGGYEKLYTWDELYVRAEGSACGSPELDAKDNARWYLTQLIKEKTGVDIDECEIPEEEIESFLKSQDSVYWFNNNGTLLKRRKKK